MNRARRFLSRVWNSFLDLLFPKGITCVICGAELVTDTRLNLCADCTSKLPYVGETRCKICGTQILNEAEYCDNCQRYDRFFDVNRAPLLYDGLGRELIKKLKFGYKKYIAEELAKLMCDEYLAAEYACDVVMYVPMKDKEKRERGYNQSELLAEEISKRLNLPLAHLLTKLKDTATQKKLTAAERRENLKGAFGVIDASQINNKSVLIVDDVFTTGATMNECARTLKKAGAKRVCGLTACITKFKVEGETSDAAQFAA